MVYLGLQLTQAPLDQRVEQDLQDLRVASVLLDHLEAQDRLARQVRRGLQQIQERLGRKDLLGQED